MSNRFAPIQYIFVQWERGRESSLRRCSPWWFPKVWEDRSAEEKEGQESGTVPGKEAVRCNRLGIQRWWKKWMRAKIKGARCLLGRGLLSQPGLRVERRRKFSSVLQKDYRKIQRNLQAWGREERKERTRHLIHLTHKMSLYYKTVSEFQKSKLSSYFKTRFYWN